MVHPSDYIVEVRDINFARIGQIGQKFLDIKFFEVFNGVGEWELKLPAVHPLLGELKTKGSGIIVTNRRTSEVYSGRTRSVLLSQNAEDPAGTWLVSGVHDNVVAATGVAFPNPAQAGDAQTVAYWTATNDGEFLMKDLVRRNLGDLALTSRKYTWLSSATDLNRGGTISVSLRFDNIAVALTEMGLRSNLGWRFYQAGAGITFDVYSPQDKSALVRLDIRNGGLESSELGWTAPAATVVYVLGQGEGEERTVRPVTSTAADAEAIAWGLRWESSKDQRNTDDPAELQEAGEAILTEKGSTVNTIKVTPASTPGQQLGIDWGLGDLVTVVIDAIPTTTTVTQVATSISSEGVIRQATVGDPVGFDWEARVGSKLADQEARITKIETNIGTGDYLTSAQVDAAIAAALVNAIPAATVKMTAAATAPAGYLLCNGAAVSRSTYATLFAAVGTTYGTGDGSTTFNLPNIKGRAVVGLDAAQTEFNVLGETGGAKTHTLTVGELPSHAHPFKTTTNIVLNLDNAAAGSGSFGLKTAAGTGLEGAATGGGDAHNNLPPYITMNFIIKF